MKSKHFNIKELVSEKEFNSNPEWKLWLKFDDRLIQAIDAVRELVDEPCFINNWSFGGSLQECGLRENNGTASQHIFGRAGDLHVKSIEAISNKDEKIKAYNNLRQKIISEMDKNPALNFIKGLENNITWLHIDVRNSDELQIFNP